MRVNKKATSWTTCVNEADNNKAKECSLLPSYYFTPQTFCHKETFCFSDADLKRLPLPVAFLLTGQISSYLPAFCINWCFLRLEQPESQPMLLGSISGRLTGINAVNCVPSLLETETAAKIRGCLNSPSHSLHQMWRPCYESAKYCLLCELGGVGGVCVCVCVCVCGGVGGGGGCAIAGAAGRWFSCFPLWRVLKCRSADGTSQARFQTSRRKIGWLY